MIEFCLLFFFVLPILILIWIGIKEYKRIAMESRVHYGFAEHVGDRKFGLSRSELNSITGEVFRADKTRKKMRELAERRRVY